VVGINSRLDTFQAAVLRVKLRRLSDAVHDRQTNAARYTRLLKEANLVAADQVVLPSVDKHAFHVWNQYSIRVGEGRRDALKAHLSERGIGSEIYYPVPMHQQECFKYLKVDPSTMVETERASREILNLPIFPSLTETEQHQVVKAIKGFYAAGAKAAA